MREQILRELQAEYEQRRASDLQEETRRRSEAVNACPGLQQLLDSRQTLIYGSLRGILEGKEQQTDTAGEMARLNTQVRLLLKSGGYPEDWLEPVYQCPLCRDTGYVGEPVREMCGCMRREYFARLYRAIGLHTSDEESFEKFSLDVFDASEPVSGGMTQRAAAAVARRICEEYADSYPDSSTEDLVLMGKSGLGKTYLMHCMARRLLERGRSVLMVSAYRFLEAARKAVFSSDSAELNSLIDADVLMLDDLGSEALVRNVTIETLFTLVNERQRAGRGMVISTNLSESEFRERYTERIASRLFDGQKCRLVPFYGADLRRRRTQ